mgnify:CR=1 FL=1
MIGENGDILKNEGFRKMIDEDFAKITDVCIHDFLSGDAKSLFKNVKKLSKVVLKHFKPMIPDSFHKIWQEGIRTNDYYLKLCGSGGGGYLLGFTRRYTSVKKELCAKGLEVIPVYREF